MWLQKGNMSDHCGNGNLYLEYIDVCILVVIVNHSFERRCRWVKL